METLSKISEELFFFVMMPIGALVNLALSLAMPTAAMRTTYFEFALATAICIGLSLANMILKRNDLEAKLFAVVRPVAAFALVMAANCGVFYLVGA